MKPPLKELSDRTQEKIDKLPETNKQGILEIEGAKYINSSLLYKGLGELGKSIVTALESSSLKPILGKDNLGRIQKFYPLPEVLKVWPDLNENDVPRILKQIELLQDTVSAELLGVQREEVKEKEEGKSEGLLPIPEHLKENREIVLAAIKNDGKKHD